MKEWKTESGEQGRETRARSSVPVFRSERGVVLVVVLVLSAVALMLMTTLIYMITTGTRISGLQKTYKTALDAGEGGGEAFYQLIALRAETVSTQTFTTDLNSLDLNSAVTTSSGCEGTASGGAPYTGLAAKLITPSTSWVGCDSSLTIDPSVPSTYDMTLELGTTKKYKVYAKIVAATEGNSGGGGEEVSGLHGGGVVSGNRGEIRVTPVPYLYTIEVLSERTGSDSERAKLSILYQY